MTTIARTILLGLLAASFNVSAAIVDITGSLNTYETLIVDDPSLQDLEVSPGNYLDRVLAASSPGNSGDATEIDWMTSTLDYLGVAYDPINGIHKIEFDNDAEVDAFWTQDPVNSDIYTGDLDFQSSHYVIKIGGGHTLYDLLLLENRVGLSLATISLAFLEEFSGFDGNNFDIYRISHVSAVPLPATFWLFGTALISFIAVSRRTKLS